MKPAIFLIASVLAAASGVASAQTTLSDAELKRIFTGKTISYADGGMATYHADGSYTYRGTDGRITLGKYTLADGQLCTDSGAGNRCNRGLKDRRGPYLMANADTEVRFTASGTKLSPASTMQLCEQNVAYSLTPPGPDVAPQLASFSGVWVGKWDFGMCAAIIVESVAADGKASIVYVNGSWGSDAKAGNRRWSARIDGNKLGTKGPGGWTEFTAQGATQLKGTYASTTDRNGGVFEKR